MLEYFQILREITGIGNDDANRVLALAPLEAGAPEAFIGLFKGDNFGKMLVRVGPDKAV